MLVKRDNEIARLREQRDQQLSELNERKQKDSVKLHSLNEYKTLAETRSVSTRARTRLRTLILDVGTNKSFVVRSSPPSYSSRCPVRRCRLDEFLVQLRRRGGFVH